MSNDIFSRPILIYSNLCKFSNQFIAIAIKHPDLFNSFIRMNIDIDPITRKRPVLFHKIQDILQTKITKVPTIITQKAEYILSDSDAFKWLDYQIKQLQPDTELTAFNPLEMISFSDHYANVGSTDLNDTTDQNYTFYVDNNYQKKPAQEGGHLSNDNYLNTNKTWSDNKQTHGFLNEHEPTLNSNERLDNIQNQRSYFDNNLQHNKTPTFNQSQQEPKITSNNQQYTTPPPPLQQQINFCNPSFGLEGQLRTNNNVQISLKTKELDKKLSELMNDRESIDNILKNSRPT